METNKQIYWKKAIELMRNGEKIEQSAIDFNNEQIHWQLVQEFNKYGIRVSNELIDYDDDNIDFSDIPELNDNNLKNGTYKIILPISCDYEISEWIKNSKINYNMLVNNFLKSVYQSVLQIERKELTLIK